MAYFKLRAEELKQRSNPCFKKDKQEKQTEMNLLKS